MASYPAWLAAISGPSRVAAHPSANAASAATARTCSSTPNDVAARTGYVSSGRTAVTSSSVAPQRLRKVAPSSGRGKLVDSGAWQLAHPGPRAAGRVLHHALAHEGGRPGPRVRQPADVVRGSRSASPTISSPGGRATAVGHRSRPAQDRQHRSGCPERHRHLIHDPARRADHMVLRLLAQRGAGGAGRCVPAPSARAVATSSAALDATPTDAGRSDVISSRTRGGVDHPVAQQHEGDPDDVVRPPGTRGQLPADILVGETRPGRRARPSRTPPGPRRRRRRECATTSVPWRVGISSTSAPE